MSHRPAKTTINPLVLDEAADWFVEFEGGIEDLATRQAFDAWLRRSPEHMQAFLELLPIWDRAAAVPPSSEIDAEQLIARALSVDANVISLPRAQGSNSPRSTQLSAAQQSSIDHRALREKWATPWSVAAACAVLTLASLFTWWSFFQTPSYATGVAEQRSIVLSDGSSVTLNARSKIRIYFDERERVIQLVAGQALFNVTKDAHRPFIVHSDDTRVQAIGTQFDVYRKKNKVTVTVLEGRVAVLPPEPTFAERAGEATPPTLLSAGEQTFVVARRVEKPQLANVTAATAWTQRRLMFQKTALADVVEEFNRYNARTLRIEDPAIQAFLVSGTFSSTDPTSLLTFLRDQPGIRVIENDREILIAAAP